MINTDRANEIVTEEFRGHGFGAGEPVVTESGELADGQHAEPAALETEDALRAQCREWIESFAE